MKHVAALTAVLALLAACEREQRRLDTPGSFAQAQAETGIPAERNPFEANAYAVAQGKRLFRWYNCNGCHANGGGGMGPPLMDATWRYGHEPRQIVETILHGRPNGMPAFAGRIPEDQAWQLAAYVRSMSAQLRADVLPGRSDALSAGEPELRRDPVPSRAASAPAGQ